MPQNGTVFEMGGGSRGPQGPPGIVGALAVQSKLIDEDTDIESYGAVYIPRFVRISAAVHLKIGLSATLKVG